MDEQYTKIDIVKPNSCTYRTKTYRRKEEEFR